jgi:hypothetical protein
MSEQFKASLDDLYHWAEALKASRAPDFVIGENYLLRWWVIPRNDFSNVYLHEFRRSDDDRAMHDHPWASTSVLIDGCYIEHTPEGRFVRNEGDVVSRAANAVHRIELLPGQYATSLFFTGPKVREWGFACPQVWRHWREFTGGENGESIGLGCA